MCKVFFLLAHCWMQMRSMGNDPTAFEAEVSFSPSSTCLRPLSVNRMFVTTPIGTTSMSIPSPSYLISMSLCFWQFCDVFHFLCSQHCSTKCFLRWDLNPKGEGKPHQRTTFCRVLCTTSEMLGVMPSAAPRTSVLGISHPEGGQACELPDGSFGA